MITIDEYVRRHPDKSQQELAEAFGISRCYFNQIMNFQRDPGRMTMERIADATGGEVSLDSWRRRSQPPQPVTVIDATAS